MRVSISVQDIGKLFYPPSASTPSSALSCLKTYLRIKVPNLIPLYEFWNLEARPDALREYCITSISILIRKS